MSWLPVLLLALLTFVGAVFLLKLPRSVWALFGAALLFGLAGYAEQGVPGMPAAPGQNARENGADGDLVVEGRREFFDTDTLPSRSMITSDAFARRGDFENAVGFARAAAQENPGDIEAWTGLGNALVEHANGTLSEAAEFAYARAKATDPGNAAADYFHGIVLIRNSRFDEGRELWAAALEAAPEDARYRGDLANRLAALDAAIERLAEERAAQ